MRVVSIKALKTFWTSPGREDAEQSLRAWISEAEHAAWIGSASIRDRYATASFLANNRVVFNIGGNKYRLVVMVKYALDKDNPTSGFLLIRFIGTHAEYDRIDAEEV